jgi:ADP-ribosylglycohydrolase
MRTVPLGLLQDLNEAESAAIAHCVTTHLSPRAVDATRMVTQIAWYLNWNIGPKADMYKWIKDKFPMTNFTTHLKKKRIECDAMMTASAAIHLVSRCTKMSEILYQGVNLRGDTDSVCSIALGLASLCDEIEPDIPKILIDNLENDQYGKDYIIQLDNELYKWQKKLKYKK